MSKWIHESNSGLYKYQPKRTTTERKGETVKQLNW